MLSPGGENRPFLLIMSPVPTRTLVNFPSRSNFGCSLSCDCPITTTVALPEYHFQRVMETLDSPAPRRPIYGSSSMTYHTYERLGCPPTSIPYPVEPLRLQGCTWLPEVKAAAAAPRGHRTILVYASFDRDLDPTLLKHAAFTISEAKAERMRKKEKALAARMKSDWRTMGSSPSVLQDATIDPVVKQLALRRRALARLAELRQVRFVGAFILSSLALHNLQVHSALTALAKQGRLPRVLQLQMAGNFPPEIYQRYDRFGRPPCCRGGGGAALKLSWYEVGTLFTPRRVSRGRWRSLTQSRLIKTCIDEIAKEWLTLQTNSSVTYSRKSMLLLILNTISLLTPTLSVSHDIALAEAVFDDVTGRLDANVCFEDVHSLFAVVPLLMLRQTFPADSAVYGCLKLIQHVLGKSHKHPFLNDFGVDTHNRLSKRRLEPIVFGTLHCAPALQSSLPVEADATTGAGANQMDPDPPGEDSSIQLKNLPAEVRAVLLQSETEMTVSVTPAVNTWMASHAASMTSLQRSISATRIASEEKLRAEEERERQRSRLDAYFKQHDNPDIGKVGVKTARVSAVDAPADTLPVEVDAKAVPSSEEPTRVDPIGVEVAAADHDDASQLVAPGTSPSADVQRVVQSEASPSADVQRVVQSEAAELSRTQALPQAVTAFAEARNSPPKKSGRKALRTTPALPPVSRYQQSGRKALRTTPALPPVSRYQLHHPRTSVGAKADVSLSFRALRDDAVWQATTANAAAIATLESQDQEAAQLLRNLVPSLQRLLL